MKIIPAIDLLGGKAVRLRRGDYAEATIYDDDPPKRAASWRGAVPLLHVVDLEGAKAGHAVQVDVVRAIVAAFGDGVQIGGGVRTREAFESYLALGVARIVLGSAAVKDTALVRALAAEHPGVVVVAVDAKDGWVATDGWTETSRVRAVDLARAFDDVPIAAILYTDIARDGTGDGPNVEATAALKGAVRASVIASGGVGSLDHVRALAARGIDAAIVGRALYEATFTLAEGIEASREKS